MVYKIYAVAICCATENICSLSYNYVIIWRHGVSIVNCRKGCLAASTGHIQLQLPGQSQLNRPRYEVYALSDSIVPAGNLCQRRSVLQGTESMAMVNRHLATTVYGVAHSDVGYIYVL